MTSRPETCSKTYLVKLKIYPYFLDVANTMHGHTVWILDSVDQAGWQTLQNKLMQMYWKLHIIS